MWAECLCLRLNPLLGYGRYCSSLVNSSNAGKVLNNSLTTICQEGLRTTDLFDYGASSLTLLLGAIVISDMSPNSVFHFS
jgi:hypothetical protein